MEIFGDIEKLNKDALNYLESAGFKFYTTHLSEQLETKTSQDGETIKKPQKKFSPPIGWDKIEVSKSIKDSYGKVINTVSINAHKSGLTVIDLDAINNDYATEFEKKLCKAVYLGLKDLCNLIVKTKKGYHMYFKANDVFYKNKVNYKVGGIDIITYNKENKGCTVFGFGSSYTDAIDNTKIHYYKIMKGNDLKHLNEINIYDLTVHDKFMEILKNVSIESYNFVFKNTVFYKEIIEECKEESKEEIKPKKERKIKIVDNGEDVDYECVDNVALYCEIMEHLNLERFTNYQEWFTLQCINRSLNIPFSIYDPINRKISGYSYEGNKKIIDNIKSDVYNSYSIGTLYYYLKQDQPEEFFKLNCVNKTLMSIFYNLNNYVDIGNYFYTHHKDIFIYRRDLEKYFMYNEYNILEEIEEDKIASMLYNFYKNIIDKLNLNKKTFKICNKFIKFLSDTSRTIQKVIYTIKSKYENKNIKFDDNFNILPFKNGVAYDFNIKGIRKIEKNDYVSIVCNVEYNKHIEHTIMKEVDEYVRNMFQEGTGKYEYVMSVIGYSLFHHLKSKCYVLTGAGGNGKSQLVSMISSVFNNQDKNITMCAPNGFFASSKYNGGERPNNTLATANHARILTVSEPDTTSFDASYFKNISGNEEINARKIRGETNVYYKARFTMFFSCNQFPKIDEVGDALERRIVNINFPFSFRDKKKIQNQNDKVADFVFSDKFNSNDKYKQAFINLIFEYMEQNIKDDYKIPEIITKETECFFMEQKLITSFLDKAKDFAEVYKIVKTDNTKDFIKTSELNRLYNSFEDTTTKLDSKKFITQLTQEKFTIFTLHGVRGIRGYKIEELDI